MTDIDFVQFEQAFRRVVTVFRVKMRPAEQEQLTRTYFKLLDAYALDEVIAAGKRCLAKQRTFPKPADWLTEVSHESTASCPPDRRHMSIAEADEHAQADARHFEDHPCLCTACVRAGVDDLPLRFVPSVFDDDSQERAYNPRTRRMEMVGHWAHGEELARWYAARAAFRGLARKAPRTLLSAVAEILDREPGMEG